MYLKKNKVTKEESYKLPEELMIEIAPHLPAKSIGRFRCVSKEWNTFLSSPKFIKSHLHRATDHHNDRIIFRVVCNRTPHVITPTNNNSSSKDLAKCRRLEVEYVNALLGSCNGLVLLKLNHETSASLVVMNPITLRATTIPTRDIIEPDRAPVSFGLGYSNVDDDYKIIVLCNCVDGVEGLKTRGFIFSLKTGSCKKLGNCPFLSTRYHRPGVYTGGCLHWLVPRAEEDYAIFAFDLSSEKFEQVTSPIKFDDVNSYELSVIGGCLALIEKRNYCDHRFVMMPVDVWVMEKPGYWRKFTIANYPNLQTSYDVVCRLGEFEFVLAKNKVKFVAYNCKTGIWRDMDIDGLPESFGGILSFKESLLCPDDPNNRL